MIKELRNITPILRYIFTLDKNIKEDLYNLFYRPKKIVSKEILDQLNDQAIAIWYMDDGSVYYNSNNCHITLAVDGFTYKDQLIIIEYFKSKYQIKFTKTKKSIRLTSRKECEKFMNIVEKYIPKYMDYKILSNRINLYKSKITPKKRKEIVGKSVIQLDLNENIIKKWDSVKEAGLILKVPINSIYSALSGKCNSKYKNFKWKYDG